MGWLAGWLVGWRAAYSTLVSKRRGQTSTGNGAFQMSVSVFISVTGTSDRSGWGGARSQGENIR